MEIPPWVGWAIFVADYLIRVGLSLRVIMRRRPVGVSLAWLAVILSSPFFGAFIYLLVGELRLGNRRARRASQLGAPFEAWLKDLQHRKLVDWSRQSPASEPLARLAESTVGAPAMADNAWQLFQESDRTFESLIRDIDAAQQSCHLEFYIWQAGGKADEVVAAMVRARQRGVVCRVLLDSVGSKPFFKSAQAAEMLRAGIALRAALPASFIRMWFARLDLRMHRKIVVIDGQIAYTGSQNLVDPRFFKQEAGVGEWVDAMVRIEGPSVEALGVLFLADWELESEDGIEKLRKSGGVHPLEPRGAAVIQVVPSGPTSPDRAILEVLLMAIYSARREVVLTTPYFVPEEALLTALITAARRGVAVKLIVPAKVDSVLVRLAGQSFRGDLAEAGVEVFEFHGGLLHTKSVTVDREFSLFGSLNLDPRSLHLNFEITLSIFDADFTGALRVLQDSYLTKCRPMDLAAWRRRKLGPKLASNVARLLGPLL